MLKVNGVDVSHCKGFAYDGCHKIYLIESDSQIEYAFEVAHAICNAFNLVMIKSEDENGSWYVHGDLNYWDVYCEEIDPDEAVSTVQACIFQHYN